ncbi:hypothetical protein HK104_008225 [Borealophlyctis nickersoniae]|nr:hypothetical protein HK104_008225 [Borealophlyctis nickersoniae]
MVVNFTRWPLQGLEQCYGMQKNGLVDVSDFEVVFRVAYAQMKAYDSSTCYAWAEYPSGDSLGVAKRDDGSLVVELVNGVNTTRKCPAAISTPSGYCPVTPGYKVKYLVYGNGSIEPVPVENATTKSIWTQKEWGIFAHLNATPNTASWFPTLRFSSGAHIPGSYYVVPTIVGSTFKGTWMGEMVIGETYAMLARAKMSATNGSEIYVFQMDGAVVADTAGEKNFNDTDPSAPKFLYTNEMHTPFISFTQSYIKNMFNGSFANMPLDTRFDAGVTDPDSGVEYLFTVSVVSDGKGLNWGVVNGAPETDYTGTTLTLQQTLSTTLATSNRTAIIITLIVTSIFLLLSFLSTYITIARPLHLLTLGMEKAKEFDFSIIRSSDCGSTNILERPSRVKEVYVAQKAFYEMIVKFAEAYRTNVKVLGGQRRTASESRVHATQEGLDTRSPGLSSRSLAASVPRV